MTHKCYICKKTIAEYPANEGSVYYGGIDLWFCSLMCFDKQLAKQHAKEEKDSVYATLHRVFNYSGQFEDKIHFEIQRTMKDYNLSYKDLNRVLHYMYDIEKIPVYKPTLYYVKDHIYAARKYYQEIDRREEEMMRLKMKPPKTVIGKEVIYQQPARRRLLLDDEEDED